MNIFKLLLLFFITLLLNADEQKIEKVSLQLQWKHQFEFAGFYAAKEKGFYRDVGLDVELIEYDKTKDITDEVLKGRTQYGLSYSSIIAEYTEGKPLVLVANFFKQSPLVLIAQEDIKTPTSLKGKKVMGVSNSIDNITLLLMLDKFGVKTKDIINIPASFNIDDFINKKVDAMSAFITNELYYLDKKGIKYNIFDPVVYGAKYYDVNLFTSKEEVLKHPSRVEKFREASIKGWEYALKNKDEIIDIILQKYNTQNKSKEALLFEAVQIEQIMFPNVYKVGSIDIERVQMIADSFIQAGFVKNIQHRDIESFIYGYKKNSLNLTDKELKYLKNKEEITICVDPNWMPLEAIINDKHVGMGADFVKLFENELGIPIRVIQTQTWSDSIEAAKRRECDLLSLSTQTNERLKYLNFTSPYLQIPLVIATALDKPIVIDISFIEHEKVAVTKGYALVEIIKNRYPNLEVVEVESIEEGFEKVRKSEVFGFADSLATIEYYFQNTTYEEFKIDAYFDEKLSLGFGVRNDDRELYTILEKIVKNISDEQRQTIIKKWLIVKYEKEFDYKLFWQLLVVLLIIALLASLRYYDVRQSNKELKKLVEEELRKSRDKDKMLFHQNKLAAMGEMLENIAHQWRQPLSQINSSVLLIDDILYENSFKNRDVEERLLEIESLTKYLSNTINDFKNFFAQDKEKKSFLLREMAEKSIYIVERSLKENNIEVVVDAKEEFKYNGYENELQQVMVVILNNAKDALVSRNKVMAKITINIELEDEFYIIKICDNAGGMTQKIRERIFEPYFTTKHKSQGTGLGLYMSKKIIEDSLGGFLSVENTPEGACFEIKLREINE